MLVLQLEVIDHIRKHGPGGRGCRIMSFISLGAASLRALWGQGLSQIHPWVPAAQHQDWSKESGSKSACTSLVPQTVKNLPVVRETCI